MEKLWETEEKNETGKKPVKRITERINMIPNGRNKRVRCLQFCVNLT